MTYDNRIAKAPKLPEGRWSLDGKVYNSREEALEAFVRKTGFGGSAQIWQVIEGNAGKVEQKGLGITVKQLSRKNPAA